MIDGLIKQLNVISKALNQYHGKPCKVCGETLRYKSNKRCVECKHRLSVAEWERNKARRAVEERHSIEAA